jgi:hypothetical protein
VISPAALLRKLASISLFCITSISLTGCGGVQIAKPIPMPVATGPQGTFVYIGGQAQDPLSFTPTANTDALASYQVMGDGSLKRLGAFDRSAFPAAIVESVAAGPWVFTCDDRPACQEFRVDNTGNLVRGADISNVHHVGAIDPTATWLIASTNQGEQAFRIQADGTLLPGPRTPVRIPQPPATPDLMGFFIITFDPTGSYVFAWDTLDINDPPGVFRFDISTGAFTRVAPLLPELTAVNFFFRGFTSDGRHAIGVQNTDRGQGDVYIFDWDPGTASLTVHSHGVLLVNDVSDFFPGFMAMADNLVFVQGGISQNVVFRFDPASGTMSDTGQRFSQDAVTANAPMRADPKTHTVMGTFESGNLIGVWKYDPATGSTKAVPGSPYASGQTPEIVGLFAR